MALKKPPLSEKHRFRRILPDILAFGLGLGTAYVFKWQTTDLVWSLWLCSLVLGYLTILATLARGVSAGLGMLGPREAGKPRRMPAILIGTVAGLFFLTFFSVHFCGFHAIHSVFLRQFFPLEGMPGDGFGKAFMNPPLLWVLAFQHLMKPYGLFLIPAIIAERRHVLLPLVNAVRAVCTGGTAKETAVEGTDEKPGRNRNPLGDAMGRPYINVVRMHLLIFFFAICHMAKIESFLVYAVVYSVYFFPWGELRRR